MAGTEISDWWQVTFRVVDKELWLLVHVPPSISGSDDELAKAIATVLLRRHERIVGRIAVWVRSRQLTWDEVRDLRKLGKQIGSASYIEEGWTGWQSAL